MISFECDYNNGACQQVMDNLVKYNHVKPTPYGFDEFSNRAKERIREACGLPDAQIFFLTGGTQTNATTIDSMLYQYEGVICVGSGHINVHEAGAVEFTEHKIITLPPSKLPPTRGENTNSNIPPTRGENEWGDGKMEAKVLDKYLDDYMHDGNKDHAVHPGLVYITFPTELGTLYSASELDGLYQVCRHYEIPLYIDGARLGYGLMAKETDVTLPYLARHCDVFYIGGTKIGALCGEAVVFTNMKAHKHFFSIQKQHGAVIAKGALIGLQFDALFTDNLYFRLSEQGIRTAMRMKEIFKRKGFTFYIDSPTNQQFVVMGNEEAERLSQKVGFTRFGQTDHHHTICRFVTSWATTDEEIDELERILEKG